MTVIATISVLPPEQNVHGVTVNVAELLTIVPLYPGALAVILEKPDHARGTPSKTLEGV